MLQGFAEQDCVSEGRDVTPGIHSCDEQLWIKSHLTNTVFLSAWLILPWVHDSKCTEQLLWWSHCPPAPEPCAVCLPKAGLFPEPQPVLSKKRPLQTLPQPGQGHSTVPRAGSGAGFARAAVGACGCSLGDYEHVCAGQSHAATVSRALRPQRLCHRSLGRRNGALPALLSSLHTGSALMGKMHLPAIKGQQGSASQVRF